MQTKNGRLCSILTRRKDDDDPTQIDESKLARVLGLVDLTALGVGSTLGLGVYVLAGSVALYDAGPAVTISFLIAAIASALAGLCYAEFASRVPRAGSAYIYSYVTVGEFCAFIIGWNLILEYAIGTAAVAKGLSNYLDSICDNAMSKIFTSWFPMHIPFLAAYADFFASGVVLLLSILLAWGVKESSNVNGIFTVVNLFTVVMVIGCGIFKANPSFWNIAKENLPPAETLPKDVKTGEGGFLPFGWAGVWAGAAKCFFGFVGFDVIATTGEEAKNPKKNIPLAIVLSLLIIFFAYFGVATVLTMMVPYYAQNAEAPLPSAFKEVGLTAVMQIITVGAICALCASLLGAIFPLPRILYAMAQDGLLFKIFGKVNDTTQTPIFATIISGLLASIVAGIFNLKQLVDMMSIGTLLAYTIVAYCILILRYEDDADAIKPPSSPTFVGSAEGSPISANIVFRTLKGTLNLIGSKYSSSMSQKIATKAIVAFCTSAALLCFSFIHMDRLSNTFNETISLYLNITFALLTVISVVVLIRQPQSNLTIPFKVPLVPYAPCVSIIMNIYLMLKLDIDTWVRFIVWLTLGFIIYVFYSINHSVQGKKDAQREQTVAAITGQQNGGSVAKKLKIET